MADSPPKFIYFDMGNVLLLFEHGIACRRMGKVAGISPERVREVVFDHGLEWKYERGELTSREFYDFFCEQTNTSAGFDELMFAAGDMFTLNVPIVPIVAHLSLAGYRLGILSNTCEAHWQYINDGRYSVITELFDVHALSFEVKAMKPEPECYQAAIKLAGVDTSDIFFMDDHMENVVAAKEAGMSAVHYTSPHGLAADLRNHGVEFNY